jgi:hypothetical protein
MQGRGTFAVSAGLALVSLLLMRRINCGGGFRAEMPAEDLHREHPLGMELILRGTVTELATAEAKRARDRGNYPIGAVITRLTGRREVVIASASNRVKTLGSSHETFFRFVGWRDHVVQSSRE